MMRERVGRAGCEALVLTTNTQIFGNREWSKRTRATESLPTLASALDAALGLLGANSPKALDRQFLVPTSHLPGGSKLDTF